jgi:hypothetical protein
MPDIIDGEIVECLALAPVQTKNAIAKRAFDALPLDRKHSDNLALLRQAINADPLGFVDLCRRENLPVDLSIVVNHHEEHHHHHAAPPTQGLTAADLAQAIQQANAPLVEALQRQQTQLSTTGYSATDLQKAMMWGRMEAQQQWEPQQVYQPQPPVYVHVDPHIRVDATSSSRQENGYHGGFYMWLAAFLLACVFGVAMSSD